MEIAGKVFIFTGSASGLGEGTARMLSANDGIVVIADMQVQITAEREIHALIAASEGRRQEHINIATGESEAFIAR